MLDMKRENLKIPASGGFEGWWRVPGKGRGRWSHRGRRGLAGRNKWGGGSMETDKERAPGPEPMPSKTRGVISSACH